MDEFKNKVEEEVIEERNEQVKEGEKEEIKEKEEVKDKDEAQEGAKEKVKVKDKEGYRLIEDNRGVGVVEIILILVILIALVLLFQTQIKDIVTKALESISNNAGSIIS